MKRVFSVLFMCVALSFAGCIDREFDLADTSGEITVGGKELVVPIGEIAPITLADIVGDNDLIKPNEDGVYQISFSSFGEDPTKYEQISIDGISIPNITGLSPKLDPISFSFGSLPTSLYFSGINKTIDLNIPTQIGKVMDIEPIKIDVRYRDTKEDVTAEAKFCYDESGIYARLETTEPHSPAKGKTFLEEPCLDSCLEFFFSPVEDDERYMNLEFNPNGMYYFGIGTSIKTLVRLLPENRNVFGAKIKRHNSGWSITYKVPASIVRMFFPSFELYSGKVMRANCYKCVEVAEEAVEEIVEVAEEAVEVAEEAVEVAEEAVEAVEEVVEVVEDIEDAVAAAAVEA